MKRPASASRSAIAFGLIGLLITLALSWLSAPSQAALIKVKGVEVSAEGESLSLAVDLSGRLIPRIIPFELKGKRPRVIIDFPGASASALPARIKSPSPFARSIRTGIHTRPEPKVRLVIDLVPGRLYRIEQWFRKDINRFLLLLSDQ